MYIGSWHTRVQVPKAAAFTRPSRSTVVMRTRQEEGAKMLSHHSGRTSILFGRFSMSPTTACLNATRQPHPWCHARAWPAHPCLLLKQAGKTWMAGSSPAMTCAGALKRAADDVVKGDRAT